MVAVGIAVIVIIATSAATGKRNENSTASNNLRNSNNKNNSFELEDSEGTSPPSEWQEGSSTLSPFDFADDDLFCQDDPDFLHDGTAGKDCAWVAKEYTEIRCDHLKVVEHCRATCDPYCASTMKPTSTMTEENRDDDQEFQNDKEEQEEQFQEEEEEQSEEEAQDDFDSDACMDNPSFRFEGASTQNCEWVASKFTSFRCSETGVVENCPATCNPDCDNESTSPPTSDFDDDGKYDDDDDNYDEVCGNNPNFRFQGEPDKNCEWVGQKFTSFRCSEAEVSENCPGTCNPDCATLPPTSTSTSVSTSDELISDEVKISV